MSLFETLDVNRQTRTRLQLRNLISPTHEQVRVTLTVITDEDTSIHFQVPSGSTKRSRQSKSWRISSNRMSSCLRIAHVPLCSTVFRKFPIFYFFTGTKCVLLSIKADCLIIWRLHLHNRALTRISMQNIQLQKIHETFSYNAIVRPVICLFNKHVNTLWEMRVLSFRDVSKFPQLYSPTNCGNI